MIAYQKDPRINCRKTTGDQEQKVLQHNLGVYFLLPDYGCCWHIGWDLSDSDFHAGYVYCHTRADFKYIKYIYAEGKAKCIHGIWAQ